MTRTVVVGASFGGLEFLYRTVRRQRRKFALGEMTVIDPRHTHTYIPLVHEVVSGVLKPRDVQFDVAHFCHAIGATFIADRVTTIDRAHRHVILSEGQTVSYDRLIIATGSVPDVPEHLQDSDTVFAAKFLNEAMRLRARILAIHTVRRDTVHVVVVGGGITGVEWSAELASRGVSGCPVSVTLITRGTRILLEFTPGIARHAANRLQRLGVKMRLSQTASDLRIGDVLLSDGSIIPSDVIIWAGGMRHTDGAHIIAPRAIEAIWQGAHLARSPAHAYQPHGPFFFGISLGRAHSMLVYRGWWVDMPVFVGFRRLLKWAYYIRFRAIPLVLRS